MRDHSQIEALFDEKQICVVFDKNLNYLRLSQAACDTLRATPENLIGKSILDLYPQITASRYHRNLMKARAGLLVNDVAAADDGQMYHTSYHPVYENQRVAYIVTRAVPAQMGHKP